MAAWPWSGAIVDIALALATFGGSVAVIAHGGIGPAQPSSGELDLVSVSLAACATLPLVAWRRFPLAVFAVTAAASVVVAGLGYRLDVLLGPGVALFLLASSRTPESAWTGRTTVVVVGFYAAYLVAAAAVEGTLPASELLHTGLAWAVGWFAGERMRLRREQIVELNARALRAERDAQRDRLLAVAEERARIARDLHDSAGNAVNVIAVRAGAARLRHRQDPAHSFTALEAIEEMARQTAEEIDQIVGSLREPGSANGLVEAPNGMASLETLIGRHREAGLEVTLVDSGPMPPLGAVVDQAAYRILQEALTNAARHGAGSARIELAFGHESVDLTVTNPARTVRSLQSGGHGLIGMRERAILLGGSFEAGLADGTFRVRARIPYGGKHP
ncbi:MAG: sensor histidine kinase [Candidatus Limnocylindrales bacterium]